MRRSPSTCMTILKNSWDQECLNSRFIPIGLHILTSSSRRLPSTLTKKRPRWPAYVRRFPSTCITIPQNVCEQEMLTSLHILVGLHTSASCSRRLLPILTKHRPWWQAGLPNIRPGHLSASPLWCLAAMVLGLCGACPLWCLAAVVPSRCNAWPRWWLTAVVPGSSGAWPR